MNAARTVPKAFLAVAAVAMLWASVLAGSAQAFRPLLSEAVLQTTNCGRCGAPPPGTPVAPTEGQLEDPCGLAIGPPGEIYVVDYYHRVVDVFTTEINERDGVCGLAVDSSGNPYVTDGNSELSNVFAYGPYGSTAAPGSFFASPSTPSAPAATAAAVGAVATPTARRPPTRRSGASASEVIQRGKVRVKVDGRLAPTALPRQGTAGVHVSFDTKIAATDGGTPPQLRQIAIAINRNGHFEPRGVPVCRLAQIQPATTAGALAACRGSLVGEGRFSADVKLPEQSPFPSAGKVLAFNGASHGHPVILAHVFGTKPVPTSFTLAFAIGSAKGTYGTVLRASVPEATGDSGFITGLSLNLGRSFGSGAHRRSYVSAGCPAPAGFPGASFPLARTSFGFAGGPKLTSVLTRSCKVR
jgi:hypothetical protein